MPKAPEYVKKSEFIKFKKQTDKIIEWLYRKVDVLLSCPIGVKKPKKKK